MHTEAEAQKLWCPMARVVRATRGGLVNHGQPAGNRMDVSDDEPGVPKAAVCIASNCAAWRWQPALTVNNPGRLPGAGQSVKRETGYCGLAGKP